MWPDVWADLANTVVSILLVRMGNEVSSFEKHFSPSSAIFSQMYNMARHTQASDRRLCTLMSPKAVS